MITNSKGSFGFEISIASPFDTAVGQVTEAMAAEGFGVLTRIDAKAIFKEKLGVEFRDYLILGVCNPQLAHQAISSRPEAGLLLPCTVTIEAVAPHRTVVRIADPEGMMQIGNFGERSTVHAVAEQARAKLERAALRLGQPVPVT
jgi:uncharacterized protein (DUF302 family)